MPSQRDSIPKWVWLVAAFVLVGLGGVMLLLLAGKLEGRAHNLVPEALIGGAVAFLALAGYLLRYHPSLFRFSPARAGVVLLTLGALALTLLYFVQVRHLVALPYDIASWSEPFFVSDVIKLRTGSPFYLAPEDSNSSVYTPGAPAVTYFLAKFAGRPASIPFYRLLQQVYLVLAAALAAASTWQLLRLALADRFASLSRWWLAFFFFASLLFGTLAPVSRFNVYLHNDPLALLASTLAFWLVLKHAATHKAVWIAAMAVMPSAGFLVKQYLAVWAVVYVLYLWLDGNYSLRRVSLFALVCFGGVAATIATCLAIWGDNFRYWVFEVMGSHRVSFQMMSDRLADAGLCLALGFAGGLVLLRGTAFRRLLGLWLGWLILVLAAAYTSGVTFFPTHLGPAAMVGNVFFLAGLATLWPDESTAADAAPGTWVQTGAAMLMIGAIFAGLGYTRTGQWAISPDLVRYTRQIEQQFEGLPPERVLLDTGDWIYLGQGILMKDRQPAFVTHRTPHYGLLDRLRQQHYRKILVRAVSTNESAFDLGGNHGVGSLLRQYYRESGRIARVQGMDSWLFPNQLRGEIIVYEPLPSALAQDMNPSAGAVQAGRAGRQP